MSIHENYNHTLRASYIGYISQAIVNNFAPLLLSLIHICKSLHPGRSQLHRKPRIKPGYR